jgi:hypothetical protein
MQYQTEIVTPLEQAKVVIKTMLTGAEQEAVDNAELQYATTADFKTFQAKEKDLKKITLAKKHELITRSVVSINADPTDVLVRLQKMPAKDYKFVYDTIVAEQKKMMSETGELT